jgi:hypothetical protein
MQICLIHLAKRSYKLLGLALLVTLLFSSCKKWLDVQPVSQVAAEDLFSTQAGFEEALNGVYTRGSQKDLYGGELTFGFPDVLAQNFFIDPSNDPMSYLQTSLYNYTDGNFLYRKDSAWKGLYNVVANCNLILQNIDSKKSLLSAVDYGIIKGEALAMRAYTHFDVLRLFAPSYTIGASTNAIPYVTQFSNKVTPLSTVSGILTQVIRDLDSAKILLKPVDPILSPAYTVWYFNNDTSTEQSASSLFLQERRHRLNYYAVCGELARAYLYMNDKQNALSNAMEVISSHKFPWTVLANFTNANPQEVDRILYNELVFAWYIPAMSQNLITQFGSDLVSLYMTQSMGANMYETTTPAGGDDQRIKQWFKPISDQTNQRYDLVKYSRDVDTNRHPLMAPAMRLSEMFYIAAECMYASNPQQAMSYVDSVRNHRAINPSFSATSEDDFLNQLVKEARKEFYGEGQIFYMYKRLNRGIVGPSGIVNPPTSKTFVLPLPNDEIEFGGR